MCCGDWTELHPIIDSQSEPFVRRGHRQPEVEPLSVPVGGGFNDVKKWGSVGSLMEGSTNEPLHTTTISNVMPPQRRPLIETQQLQQCIPPPHPHMQLPHKLTPLCISQPSPSSDSSNPCTPQFQKFVSTPEIRANESLLSPYSLRQRYSPAGTRLSPARPIESRLQGSSASSQTRRVRKHRRKKMSLDDELCLESIFGLIATLYATMKTYLQREMEWSTFALLPFVQKLYRVRVLDW